MRYNCTARTADLLMKVYYAEDGSEITTITASYYGKLNYVIPDTEGELKFERVCQYKKTEEKKPAAVTRKKSEKSKEADKAVESKEVRKETPTAKAPPISAFPSDRSRTAIKPSGTLPASSVPQSKAAPSK